MRLLRFAVLLILSLQMASIIAKKPKYCGERFAKMRDKICRWPGEQQPCLQLHHSIKERVRTKCCAEGCSLEEMKEEMCCMTDVCLRRCYPGKGYRLGSVY
ncbi:hypothetical protein niasHT_007604 [Heterodera trifolii]|uniref:INSulin related n=1 Tax=Heterodera trifolii TaxID=157864 RepID=A0ABD2LPM7_9BILA